MKIWDQNLASYLFTFLKIWNPQEISSELSLQQGPKLLDTEEAVKDYKKDQLGSLTLLMNHQRRVTKELMTSGFQ